MCDAQRSARPAVGIFERASNDAAYPTAIVQQFSLRLSEAPKIMVAFTHMTFVERSNRRTHLTCWLAMLAALAFLTAAESDDNRSATTTGEKRAFPSIRIFDQHGRQVPSGKRLTGSQVFDVAVGPSGSKLRFVPDTLNVSVGDPCDGPGAATPTVLPAAPRAQPTGNSVPLII